jgi:hypothetical protein
MPFKAVTIESMDETGKGRARIAQLAAVDYDGDTYAPGAFSWKTGGGQWVQMIPAHNRQAMPFGKAWLFEQDGWALADFTLNLATQTGKEWHETLKFDLATGLPVQEWSYGFQTLDYAFEQREGMQVRVLKKLDCDEISPVLRGAGVGTGTLSIKAAALKENHFAVLIEALGELASVTAADASVLSATGRKQLEDIHAALGKALAPKTNLDISGSSFEVDEALYGFLLAQSQKHLPRRG